MNRFIIFIFLLYIFIPSCEDSINEPSDTDNNAHPDTLMRFITDGAFVRLDSLKDSYSLNEIVKGYLLLVNESDTNGISIDIGSYPPLIQYQIFNADSEMVFFYSMTIGFGEYRRVLMVGDSITDVVIWSQHYFDPATMISGLKAFSGLYRINAYFRGNSFFYQNPLIKWIEITEEGDPLSAHLEKDYDIQDTIKVDFIIRNRISNDLLYQLIYPYPIEINFIKYPADTVLTLYDSYPKTELLFPSKNDSIVYTFVAPKSDSIFNGFSSSYTMNITLHFQTRNISSSTYVYFWN